MRNITNTTPLTQLFEVGEIIFLEEDPTFSFEVLSPKMVSPLFGETKKSMSFANGVKLSLEILTGDHVNDFQPNHLVVNKDGLTVTQVGEEKNITVPMKNKKGKGGVGPMSLLQKTVYSQFISSDQVVRSDIPEAVGYDSKSSKLWNDYLDGGEGALADWTLQNKLLKLDWNSDCCDSFMKKVAGIELCSNCGGEFSSSARDSEGS